MIVIQLIGAASPKPLVSEIHHYSYIARYAYLTKISATAFAWHACEMLEVV